MSKVTVCVRFRPLNEKEKGDTGCSTCVKKIDVESFTIKDEKDANVRYCFDRVFYQDSAQADIYDFLAAPIIQDAIMGTNGTIIMYGQVMCLNHGRELYGTGAGKTYSMEGPSFLESDGDQKGILQRVLDQLFECMEAADEVKYTVKFSMVEIYMEKVRDLLDLSKDNLQIKEAKSKGIYIHEATEICVQNSTEALQCLSIGIANRAVGETQMNAASSRSHCMYIFSVQQESTKDGFSKSGKLVLVDLAGSEKVEKTKAEGKVLDEAKTINKSLSALGNVIKALTNGKMNHIPYRDSKLTRFLQDALGGNSRTALLCCCSPSSDNQSESLSTLRFGARAKLIKLPPVLSIHEPRAEIEQVSSFTINKDGSEPQTEVEQATPSKCNKDAPDRILAQLTEKFNMRDVKLLEELFVLEGIIYDPDSVLDYEQGTEDVTHRTIEMLQQAVKELSTTASKLEMENCLLKGKIEEVEQAGAKQSWFSLDRVLHWLWSAKPPIKFCDRLLAYFL